MSDSQNLLNEINKPENMSATDELAWALSRVLNWPNPHGLIKDAYLPGWLSQHANEALARYLKEPK